MNMSPRSRFAVLLLVLAPFVASCIVIAAGASFLITREVLPNKSQRAQVTFDVDKAWPAAQAALREMSTEGTVTINDFPRRAKGEVDGYSTTVLVEAYDIDRSTITVESFRYSVPDAHTAERVMNRIIEKLSKVEAQEK